VVTSQELQPFLLGGIQTHENDHQRWMAALHQSGMNAVQVTVYAHQGPWNTAKLWYAEEEPSVLDEIRAARQNGLQVVLVLRVALDHNYAENRHLWHGLIYPQTEKATLDWFRIYTDFVVKWARIAEQEGIAVLGVASEMNSLAATLPVDELPALAEYYLDDASQERLRALVGRSKHLFSEDVRVGMGAGDFESLDDFLVQRNQAERGWARAYTFAGADDQLASMNRRRKLLDARWRHMVQQVRQVYSGRLTLAANFDNYHEVSFWDELDFMGINAYFPLRETLETPLSEDGLAANWREIFGTIQDFRETHDLSLKVLFTELGYTRWRGVTVAPWSSQGFIPLWDPEGELAQDRAFFWSAQPIEPAERALALQALHRVWSEGRTDLAGVLYWKLSSLLDLQRFEPFMLYLGERAADPLFAAFTQFARGIRPLGPFDVGDDRYLHAMDAIVRDDLEALVALGSKVLASPPRDRGPLLHLAVRLGRGEIARYLLKVGAGRGQRDAGGFLPLHWACYQDDPELVELLQPPAGDSWHDARNETPLMKCARLDNKVVALRLLQDHDNQIHARNDRRQNALHLAADQASVEIIEALIANGGEVDAYDESGLTPLHLAARRGEVEVVRALAQASKGRPNLEGNRPAHEAAIYGRREVFQLLFEPQQAREINIYGQSLLHLAAHGGDLEILKTLFEHLPQVDLVDLDGWTPLAFATRNAQLAAVELLIEKGASIEHRNLEGTSALHLAGASYDPRLIQHFVRQDVNLDLADGQGNTALHHSAGWGYLENIQLLLAAGANINSRNHSGLTPLGLAEKAEKLRATLLLRAAKAAGQGPEKQPAPVVSNRP
jgi:ankyrin repeat protein